MNEQAIIDSYNLFVQNGYKKSLQEYKQLISSNPDALNDSYGLFRQNGYAKSLDDYKTLVGVGAASFDAQAPAPQEVKKKDTGLPSGVGSSASPVSTPDPEALRFAELVKKQGEITPKRTDEPGYIDPRKKLGMYPTREEADKAINQAFSDISVTTGKTPELGEYDDVDYFTGSFGNVLRGFDKVSQTGLGELVDDIGRSFAQGYAQGDLAQASNKVIRSGNEFTEEDIQSLIDKSETLNSLPPSQEFQKYLKTYEEEGKSVWGAVKGLMENPTVLGEVAVSSLVGMATNRDAVLAGLGTLAAAFGAGAATGGTAGTFVVPGIGTAVGGTAAGLSAAVSALPYAFGAASTVVETGATFAQLLQEELGTDELGNPIKPTKENVKAILEDPQKFEKIRNDAIARGFTVGIIDAVGGKLATGVGAKILRSSARATGSVTKSGLVKALGTGGVIEGGAGATGEVLGQVVIDKPIDTGNAVLEFAAEMPGAIRTTLMAGLRTPMYKVNGERVSSEVVDDLINTMTPEQLLATKIDIANDFEGRKEKIQDKIVTGEIANQVREAQPDLNDATVNAIVDLQKQLNILEGNKTQVAKDRAALLRARIKELQENQIVETKPVQEDAIQEQAAGQVPIQPTTGVSQEVAQGEPQAEPQVTAEEGVQEEVIDIESKARNKDVEIENISFNKEKTTINDEGISQLVFEGSFLNDYDLIAQGSESTVYRSKDKSHVIKFSEPYSSKDPNVYEKRVKTGLLKDILFDSGIEVVGYYNYNGTKNPIFRQNYVEGEILTENEAENYLRDNNKVVEIDNKFYTKYNDVLYRVADLENNLIRDKTGNVVPIDLNISEVKDNNIIARYEEEVAKIQPQVEPAVSPVGTQEVEELVSQDVEPAPKLVRDVSVLITPATVRAASPLTKRIKTLSLKYDKLVKDFSKKKSKETLDKIKETEAQILNDAKQEIIDDVSKVKGVAVAFGADKRGLWDGKFEPSLNMVLSISQQADTESVSKMLFDFAEKYSQDAFILESESNYERDVFEGRRGTPLTEFDENGLMHYPQIIYTFAEPITDEQVADLSVSLQNNGVDAFSINNNEIKVSVIKFFPEDSPLNEDEQNEERKRDLDAKSDATEKSAVDVLGPNVSFTPEVRIKKSSYQGARNEGTEEQTREYDRSNVLESFKEAITNVEVRSTELANLRKKQIQLQKEGKQLSKEEQDRFDELNRDVQPTVQRTFEVNKALYEDAKTEVEKIAADAIKNLNASLSPFPIKRPERASVKTIRWYNSFTERLGDGARVNIVVQNDADADKVFNSIDQKYPVAQGDKDLRRIKEDTNLGYPKRLIEVRTPNGIIAEIQVITTDGYLAKDGVAGFTGDQKQKDSAKKALAKIRKRLGWAIPDGLGHYFYEIHRDVNVDDNLRADALKLSNLYYDAFTNPESTLTESFMDDVITFKNKVDTADKTNWDKGNEGKTPAPLTEYINQVSSKTQEEVAPVEVFAAITASDVKTKPYIKENAIEFEEGTREDIAGRKFKFLSSITVEATDANGNPIGTITKLSDGENRLSFTVEDSDGRKLNKGKEFNTERDAKVALAEQVNKQRQKAAEKQQQQAAKETKTVEIKAEKAKAREKAKQKPKTEEEVVEEVAGKMDELLELDPKSKGTGQKILDGIDGLIKDIENLEKGTLGVNIALPIMKNILKGIRTLVEAGMVLADAIKQVAKDNGVTVKQVVNGINAVSQIVPIQKEYDALMTKADALIARQKSRGITDKKIVSNLDTMVRDSDVYKNATDAQRKIMEREARIQMGVGPRKAASIGRVIGVLKDITNVSRNEKLQIIGRIRELSRDVAKDLAEEVRGLAKEGKITAIQAANIIAKFGNVNLLNEISVSNFVDYMAKVFADAEYDSKIARANSRVAKARKNIATKIGIADGLMLPLQKLFAVNPNLIPDNSLERYLELLDMFSASEAVLTLEEKSVVKKDVDAILNEINNEQSRADELAELFSKSDNQVFDDGDLNYAASLKNMVREGEITEDDADLMRKYKQDIIPQVEPTPLSDEEIAKKKNESISVLQKQKVNAEGLPSQDERNLAKRLAKFIKETSPENLMKLNLTDLKNLLKVTSNINNNYLPHYAQVMVEKLNAINNGKVIAGAIKTAKPLSFSALYSKLKAAIIRSQKGGISELVRRNPLFYIDQVFGNFKTKDIFNALFEKAAEGEANFKAELKKVQNILENAESKVAKSFKLNPDKTLMSKFKMMTYMIQLEYESNKGSQQVNPAADYLKATIKHIDEGKSRFGERDGNMLQDILDKYSTNGQIDIEKLYNSFNQAEKDAINDIRGINESLKDKAQYTAAIIRGDAIDPLNNYVHLNVLHDTEPLDMSAATDFLNQANNSRRPSTRAKSLITRTKGAKPLNFDVFASAQRGAKFVLLDYNLTEPIRTARRTINQATADLEKEGRLPKQQREIKNAIEGAFEESVTNLLTNSILQNTFADEVIDFIGKQGYRAVLAGTGRFAAELTSNISFALLADPKAFTAGTKYRDIIMSTDAPLVLENVNSKQTNRIFPADTLAGRLVDTSILNQAAGIQSSSSKNPVFNKMQQIYNLTIKKPKNIIELAADTLISTPDKLVMRPLWFGSFANEFKSITGNDVDFKKIAENNEAYMEANKDAIEQSKKLADERSVMAGATDNAFMGILKGTLKPNQSGWAKAFNNFNNYMTRFLIFEYMTARTAIYALVGDGSLSKKQGAAMLGAVFTRMTVYTVLSSMLASGIMGLVGFDDEEDETEKSLMQKIGQSLVGTFASLLFGRDFGNATKLAINYGLEEINEKYLDFLREGDYDPYKDGIAYSLIPREDRPNDNLPNLLMSMSGSLGPALNTADLIYKNRTRIITGKTTKKELDAIQREERTVKQRIPLEVLGHLGFIPFYKDVRKAVNNSIYSSIKEAEKAAVRSEQKEVDLLGGYENKEDLKRYNRALYEKNFGEGSEWYQSTKEEREAKEKEAKEERANKDRMYNYTPKEDGFGSSGFGEGTKKRQRKSGGGFGGKKFGED
jgi:hypothetical protein